MGIKAQTIINKVKNSLDLPMIEVAKEISSGLQEEKWKKKKKKIRIVPSVSDTKMKNI